MSRPLETHCHVHATTRKKRFDIVTTGPYAIVQHPMYLGVFAMFLSTPAALDLWWAMMPALLLVTVPIARIRNEELLLVNELKGFKDYTQTTKYRLISGVW